MISMGNFAKGEKYSKSILRATLEKFPIQRRPMRSGFLGAAPDEDSERVGNFAPHSAIFWGSAFR